ncbi:MAG TPA: glutaredoxin family protein [Polyangia bacterium]|jgi:glutaredoxin|nr:glutaredoxin family protein [Polyangia bacterium]
MRRIPLGLLLVAFGVLGAGCRRSAPDAPVPARTAPQTLEVLKDGRWLFTYVESNGQFATTDKPDAVPEAARALVRVFDPANPPPKNSDSPEVFVADLNQLMKSGKAPAKPMSREAFETAALAQLPPGENSALAARPPGGGAPGPAMPPVARSGDGGAGGPPVVTIYGTSWCGACRAARQYLTERKIPFADKDVENDPAAARELADKASKLGVPTDRVPVIDVRGRLLLGFDRARIEALLGEST